MLQRPAAKQIQISNASKELVHFISVNLKEASGIQPVSTTPSHSIGNVHVKSKTFFLVNYHFGKAVLKMRTRIMISPFQVHSCDIKYDTL